MNNRTTCKLACLLLAAVLFPHLGGAQGFSVSPATLEWDADETEQKNITIQCSGAWSADSLVYSGVFRISQNTGSGYTVITVWPLSVNTSPDDREAEIAFFGNNGMGLVSVVQHGVSDPDPGPEPDPEPDPWADIAADLPAGRSWIQRATVTAADGSSFFRDVSFYDGLGYREQDALVGASPVAGKTLYTPVVYDRMRRDDATVYLPYAAVAPNGVYDADALMHAAGYYQTNCGDTRPFAEKVYGTSPVGRPLSFQREGQQWNAGAGHKSTFNYRMNTAADAVPKYRAFPGTGKAACEGTWPAGSLLCTETVDEEGDIVRTFADAHGKTVLTEAGTARTLFVYDLRDSLVLAVQPEGVRALAALPAAPLSARDISLTPGSASDNGTVTDRYCFVRAYDRFGNVIREHTPGGSTVEYVYDARNRQVLRDDGRAILTLYDAYDRVVEERYVSRSQAASLTALREMFRQTAIHTMSQSALSGYFPTIRTLRTAEYFPFGSFVYPSSGDGAFIPEAGIATAADLETVRVGGQLRSETVYPAPDTGGSIPSGAPSVTRYYHYDSKGRVIQVSEKWTDTRSHRVSTKYSFTGDVLATREVAVLEAEPGGGEDRTSSLATFYARDPRGRVLSCARVLDDTDTLATVFYAYDDLGRLSGKAVGDVNYPSVQSTVSYDLHGWATGISTAMRDDGGSLDTAFAEALRYASPVKDQAAARYDGNISETAFTHAAGNYSTSTDTWSYRYDALKRLTDANHYVGASSTASLSDTERGISYDLNGNITALKRYGESGLKNDLSFSHTGNRMTALSDANATGPDAGTKTCSYDTWGNLTYDGRKGMSVNWNILNLAGGATRSSGSLSYAWLSVGTKVSARADDGSGHGVQKRYLGSFVYSNNTDLSTDRPTEVESIAWDEGRLFFDLSAAVEEVAEPGIIDPDLVPEMQEFPDEPIDSVDVDVLGLYRDCLFVTDHLGNVRTVIDITTDMVSPSIMEQNNYLPFGTLLPRTDPAYDFGNRWRYAAKEEQRFGPADLGLLDFGARMYDPFTARWTAVDPMAAKYPGHSPFNYCEGSPINRIDPQGDTIVVLYAKSGARGFGHMAILIQDENGVYHLWSKNGDKKDDSEHADNEDRAIASIQDFLDNQSNYISQKTKKGGPYYTFGYMIATTSEQDALIKKTMKEELDKEYNVLYSNCGEAVFKSLKAGKVSTSNTALDCISFLRNGPVREGVKKTLDYMVPFRTINNIILGNPRGKLYLPSKRKN